MEDTTGMTAPLAGMNQMYGLTPKQYQDVVKAFQAFDDSGDGLIDMEELEDVLRLLGQNPSYKELQQVMDALDQDKSGQIDFSEFLPFMAQVIKLQSESTIEGMLRKKMPAYIHGTEPEIKSVGDRRKVVNWLVFLTGITVPWLVFSLFFWLNSFKYWEIPNWTHAINSLTVFFFFYFLYRYKRRMQLPTQWFLAFQAFAHVLLGMFCGNLNFWFYLHPYYQLNQMATYNAINPSRLFTTKIERDPNTNAIKYTTSTSSRPTEGKRYQDGGKFFFRSGSNVVIDTDKVISFKNHDDYCAAPIVDKSCGSDCGFDMWAVGKNCCGNDGSFKWTCEGYDPTLDEGNTNNPLAERKDRTAVRWIEESTVPFYRLAVLEAEGIHNVKSAHPLFLRFFQNGRDPEILVATYAQTGIKVTFALLFFVFVLNIFVMLGVAKRFITTKVPSLEDF
ncbi:unnamed protein product [Amoebophrya sp. A120]|nr:unnamed protein product [Amoebophrya sp. A120]|eukprot:GSA120T00015816001.1